MFHIKSSGAGGPAVRLSWLGGVLVVIVTAIVFSRVVHFDFVAWDDDMHIITNPRFHPVTWDRILTFWREPYARLYIPLTYTAWGILAGLYQTLTPGPLTAELFHRLNLILHVASVLVVYRLGLLLLNPSGHAVSLRVIGAAVAGAFVFGLHPLQIESVAWVSGLKDVLCGAWALIAVWQYLEYGTHPGTRQRAIHYTLATAAFALALLAKPAAVVVPLIAALLATQGIRQPLRSTTRTLLPWFALAAVWTVLTKWQQPDMVMEYVPPLWGRLIVAADAVAFYLRKLVWPFGLGPDYGHAPQKVLQHVWGYIGGLVPLGLAFVLWQWRNRLSGLLLAAAIFVAGLLPVLGFVPFLFQGHSTVADRYVYLALLGPALGLGWTLQQQAHRKVVWIASVMFLGLLAWRTGEHVQVWQNTMTLFTQALQVNPRSAIAHGKLGTALAQQGEYQEAIAHYRAAIQLRPNYVSAHNNLGQVYYKQGNLTEAIARYRTALRIEPDRAEVHVNLGRALAEQGKLDEAIHHYSAALHSEQNRAQAHTGIGRTLAAQGKLDMAIAHYTEALKLNPETTEAHYNLGNALMRRGQQNAAIVHYTKALRLDPTLAEVHNNLGSALDDQGRIPEAIPHYQAAIGLKPDFAEAYNNLGDAWLDLGHVQEAVNQFTTAVRLRPEWTEAHYNLGIALTAQGKHQDAMAAYRQALSLRPSWPPATLKLAWLLATQPGDSVQQAHEAVTLAEQANGGSGGADAVALHTLALAYRAAGRELAALQTARRALDAAAATGNTALMAQIETQFPRRTQEGTARDAP